MKRRYLKKDATKVVYIAGYVRSGSTLLDRLLGSSRHFVSSGELFGLWRHWLDDNHLCSCGVPLNRCSFWNGVLEETFNHSVSRAKIQEIHFLQNSIVNKQHILPIIWPSFRTGRLQKRLIELQGILGKLYKAISVVSGAEVVVDSSKNPLYGFLLSEVETLDLRVIHLVRDSRAVVYSYIRKRFVPELGKYTDTRSVFRSCLGWNFYNLCTEWLKGRVGLFTQARYEDLAQRPKSILQSIAKALKIEEYLDYESFVSRKTVNLAGGHLCVGNPMRFKHGVLEIRPDLAWQKELNLSKRVLATTLTYPLLSRYY